MKRLQRLGFTSCLVLLVGLATTAIGRSPDKNTPGSDQNGLAGRNSAYVDTDQEKRDKEERDKREQERQRQEQLKQQEQERQKRDQELRDQQQRQEQERQRQEQLKQQQYEERQKRDQEFRDQQRRQEQLKQQQDQLKQQQEQERRQKDQEVRDQQQRQEQLKQRQDQLKQQQEQERRQKDQEVRDQQQRQEQLKQRQDLLKQQQEQERQKKDQEVRDQTGRLHQQQDQQRKDQEVRDQLARQRQEELARKTADQRKTNLLVNVDGRGGGGRGDGGGSGGRGDGGKSDGGKSDNGTKGDGNRGNGGSSGSGRGDGGNGRGGRGDGGSGGGGKGVGSGHDNGGSGHSGGTGGSGQGGSGRGTGDLGKGRGNGGSGGQDHTNGTGGIARDRGNRGGGVLGGGTLDPQTREWNGRGGNHNEAKGRHGSPIIIGRPPVDRFPGDLAGRVRRDDDVHRRDRDHWRSGYWFYFVQPNWCDDSFFYPYYYYDPLWDTCVISPWYYYPHLPGYIGRNRIFVLASPPILFLSIGSSGCYWSTATVYNWSPPVGNDRPHYTSDLDYALDDLRTAFMRNDRRAISRLVPHSGRVGIFVDEKYSYSLPADDFYDLMLDNVTTTKTISYDVVDVRTHGDEVRVVARHEYTDTWDRNQVVYHTYRLVAQSGGYTIADFGTSDYQPRL